MWGWWKPGSNPGLSQPLVRVPSPHCVEQGAAFCAGLAARGHQPGPAPHGAGFGVCNAGGAAQELNLGCIMQEELHRC